ncbi:MAG: hypothetical protein IPN86_04465 [Saprospiraceae bacterium]|nr:hypothetical protein [Saprospiraceae bacterium]
MGVLIPASIRFQNVVVAAEKIKSNGCSKKIPTIEKTLPYAMIFDMRSNGAKSLTVSLLEPPKCICWSHRHVLRFWEIVFSPSTWGKF